MIKPDRVIALRSDRTVYQHGSLCGKVFSRAYACVDVLQEARNLAAAWEAGASVPRFIEVTRADDRWVLVTEYVRGETLAQRMASGDHSASGCLSTLVEAQLTLQSARAERFAPLRDELRKEIAGTPLAESTRRWLLEHLDGMEDGGALCHGDLGPDNLILPAQGVPVAVDWDRACQGSADADAAATWLSLALEQGPEAAERYLELYCASADSLKDDILRWLPLMAASRLRGCLRREKDVYMRIIGQTMKDGNSL